MLAIYRFIVSSNNEISARYETIQQWYEFFERLNILMQDYTVDYEEYYNRQMVWCSWTNKRWIGNFEWNVWTSWYCTNFTAYGNYNSTNRKLKWWIIPQTYHDVYYCTTNQWGVQAQPAATANGWFGIPAVYKNDCGEIWTYQSFWQYVALFTDVKGDVEAKAGTTRNSVWDSDDRNLWETVNWNINAIADADNIQELYFISHDGKNRLYFRRKLVNTKDKYAQYKIQMLRLRGFDAWQKHSFDETTNNEWLYDWKIDTWACDAWMWFEPKDKEGKHNIWWAYSSYYLPADSDDCWIDLTRWSTSILSWKIAISPTTDSELAWAKQERQINAYMKILVVNGLYPPYYGALTDSAGDFKVPLETIINMKDFYRN